MSVLMQFSFKKLNYPIEIDIRENRTF